MWKKIDKYVLGKRNKGHVHKFENAKVYLWISQRIHHKGWIIALFILFRAFFFLTVFSEKKYVKWVKLLFSANLQINMGDIGEQERDQVHKGGTCPFPHKLAKSLIWLGDWSHVVSYQPILIRMNCGFPIWGSQNAVPRMAASASSRTSWK